MFEGRFSELLIIFVLALIVLGPEKLPRLVSEVGRWVGRARAMARQFREQLEEEVSLEEARKSQAKSTPQPDTSAPQSQASQPQPSPPETSGHQAPAAEASAPPYQSPTAETPQPPSSVSEHQQSHAQAQPQTEPYMQGFVPPEPPSVTNPVNTTSDTYSYAHTTDANGANPDHPTGAAQADASVDPPTEVSPSPADPHDPHRAQHPPRTDQAEGYAASNSSTVPPGNPNASSHERGT